MSVEIIEKNQLQLEKISNEGEQQIGVVNRLTAEYKSLIKCKTADTLPTLYVPKIQQMPSADNIIDAKNFVEEYEEYHESCSEMHDSEIAIGQVMAELSDHVENAIMERQINKKKKVGTIWYFGLGLDKSGKRLGGKLQSGAAEIGCLLACCSIRTCSIFILPTDIHLVFFNIDLYS